MPCSSEFNKGREGAFSIGLIEKKFEFAILTLTPIVLGGPDKSTAGPQVQS